VVVQVAGSLVLLIAAALFAGSLRKAGQVKLGFDPDHVPADRRGVRESIVGRMERHGGRAVLHTAPGEGTEIELVMKR